MTPSVGQPSPPGKDPDALREALFARYRSPLMAFFRRRTGDAAEAEDLAHEVLVPVLQHADRKAVDNPDAFIFMTARNLLRDRARRADVRERAAPDVQLLNSVVEGVTPERVIQGKQDLSLAIAALGELGEKTRDIFVLARLERMTYREIAELYGVSVSAVEKHLVKAFAHLMDRTDRT